MKIKALHQINARTLGLGLIVAALLLNQWSIAYLISADHHIESLAYKLPIYLVQLGLLAAGIFLIRRKSPEALPSPWHTVLAWGGLLVLLVGGIGTLWAGVDQAREALFAQDPPISGTIPVFEGIDQTGQPYGTRQLRNRVWVAHWTSTPCGPDCTAQDLALADLQARLQNEPF